MGVTGCCLASRAPARQEKKMSTQRYAVEFGRQVVGIAFRVPGGFMFISSDPRFDRLEGEMFPRVRALARRLGEMCDADRLTVGPG